MSATAICTPDPDLGGGAPGAGCAPSESWGDVALIHECPRHPGEFKKTTSDGPIEWIAPIHRFQSGGDTHVSILGGLVFVEIAGTTVAVTREHVTASLGDAEIEVTASQILARVGDASTETTGQHIAARLGVSRAETTADKVEVTVGDSAGPSRWTVSAERIEAVAPVLSAVIPLPASEAVEQGVFVGLGASGVYRAGPVSGSVIGSTMSDSAAGVAYVRLNGMPFEARAGAPIAPGARIAIDAQGLAIPWADREIEEAPERGIALHPAAAGEQVLILKICPALPA